MSKSKMKFGFFTYCKSRTQDFIALLREDWFRTVFCLSLTFLLPEYLAIGSVFLALLFLIRTMKKEKLTLKCGWLGILLVLYVISGYVSCFFALKPIHSFLMASLWAAMMIGYFAFTTILTDRDRLRITLQTFLICAFICGILGILQYILNLFGDFLNIRNIWFPLDNFLYETFSPEEFSLDWSGNRIASTFSNPNLYAMEMVLVLPLGLYCLTTASSKNSRILHAALLLVSLVGSLFTFSRSFYFTIIPMIIAYLLLSFTKSKLSRWGFLVFCAALVLFKLIPNPFFDRFTYLSFGDVSISKRFEAWIIAIRAFLERPLCGYGIGSLNAWQLLKNYGLTVGIHHMHNLPLELLAEGGLIALLIFAVMGLNVSISSIKLHRVKVREDSMLGTTFLVVAAGFVLFSVAQFPMTTPKSIILFILMFGLIDAGNGLRKTKKLYEIKRKTSV